MVEKTGVIYLLKDKFQFYSPNDGKIFEFRFVPELIRDLDVINSGLLENYIKAFITNSRIRPSNLVFVLAENAYFSKDFVTTSQQKSGSNPDVSKELLQKQADEFIEHVPFDNVVSKTIPIKDGIKVCATNKDFYEAVAIAFEHLGFIVESVVPGFVLGNGFNLRPVLDQPMANLILQKINSVSQYNLLNQQVYQPPVKQETEEIDEVELEQQRPKKNEKKNIYALIGMVPVLLGLLIVLYAQFQTPPPTRNVNADNTTPIPQIPHPLQSAPTIVPSSTVTVPVSSSPNGVSPQNLTVQIVDASASPEAGQSLLGRLDTYKFKSVSLQTASSTGSSGTLVSFSPAVSQDIRSIVLEEVKKITTNVIVQEKQIGDYDITVVLGQ